MHNIILREGSSPSEKATVSVVVKLIIGFLVKIALKPDFFENLYNTFSEKERKSRLDRKK